jgi:hypothetical protein
MGLAKSDDAFAADRDLYSGLIRLHVLHHASEEPIFGFGMVEELAGHGYRITFGSPITPRSDPIIDPFSGLDQIADVSTPRINASF